MIYGIIQFYIFISQEHIRQSKESKLDEAGRSSMKRSLENVNRIAPRYLINYKFS